MFFLLNYNELKMNKIKIIGLLFLLFCHQMLRADEGMWLLQLLEEQNAIELMKQQGLKLKSSEVYNPNGVSLKDAVGIFGGGCTGEIISPEGLILTNHHCGYSFIQQHSSVENDYLTLGFWAKNRQEELPTPGLTFTFVHRIEDVTSVVNEKIENKEITVYESFTNSFLDKTAQAIFEKSDLYGKKGIKPQLLPFYGGNKYYMIYKKIYSDVRMVAAPPSSVGKFGGETDNWMWPRHTGDFSIFRIYADEDGEPAEYNESNVPLKSIKHFSISLKGIEEDDYAMILGFPGRTSRYLTVSEVKERMESVNEPRIQIREERLAILREVMDQDEKTRIQYANKFASSSNYWKNSIGMNKAIIDNEVLKQKQEQEELFYSFAKEQNSIDYMNVIAEINGAVAKTSPLMYQLTALSEAFMSAIEFTSAPRRYRLMREALETKDEEQIEKQKEKFRNFYNYVHNKDYDHEVDRKVAKAIFPLYAEMMESKNRPTIYAFIEENFANDYNAFVDSMYDNSIVASQENLNQFLENPTIEQLDEDLLYIYYTSIIAKYEELKNEFTPLQDELNALHKTYIRGLGEMKLPVPSYPDANFTIRLTYGKVKSYSPRDGVHYRYYTTSDGVLEKEDPTNREFNVPAELKELIQKRDFGRYAMKNGDLPVCFLSTNDITGGNSGSPVLNAKGHLIGTAFDGNWESLSGDLVFDDDLQRCINVDIRYVLFILDKLGGCGHLLNEMTIIE